MSDNKCNYKDCNENAFWEIGFSAIIENSSFAFECGDDVVTTQFFCDKHFVGFGGCGNALTFRRIGKRKWLKMFEHDCELEKFVKKRIKEMKKEAGK